MVSTDLTLGDCFSSNGRVSEVQPGNFVIIHYRGWLDDMTEFCNTYENNEPVGLWVGKHEYLPALEGALIGMKPGEVKQLRLNADQAYGRYVPQLVFTVPIEKVPPGSLPELGEKRRVVVNEDDGVEVTVIRTTRAMVVVDGNHPLVDRSLNFKLEVLETHKPDS